MLLLVTIGQPLGEEDERGERPKGRCSGSSCRSKRCRSVLPIVVSTKRAPLLLWLLRLWLATVNLLVLFFFFLLSSSDFDHPSSFVAPGELNLFAEMDANGDQQLTREELEEYFVKITGESQPENLFEEVPCFVLQHVVGEAFCVLVYFSRSR